VRSLLPINAPRTIQRKLVRSLVDPAILVDDDHP
jgi:hypothetical protein